MARAIVARNAVTRGMTRRVQQTAWLVLGIGLAVCGARALSHRYEIVTTRAQAREVATVADSVRHDVLTLRNVMQESTVVGRASDWAASVERPLNAVKERLQAWRQREGHAAANVQLDSALEELGALQQNAIQAQDFLQNGQRALASEVVLADGAQLSNALYTRLSDAQRLSVDALERSMAQLAQSETSLIIGLLGLGAVGFIALGPVVFRRHEHARDVATAGKSAERPAPTANGETEVDAPVGAPAHDPQERTQATGLLIRHDSAHDDTTDHLVAPGSAHGEGAAVQHEHSSVSGPSALPLADLARLCTEFARVKERQELEGLLDAAMHLLDARGLIVWHPIDGRVLRPVLARGYGSKTLARMPDLPLADSGSISGAFRAGELRVIVGRNGDFGALVLPMLSAEGCLGVVTLELRSGESTDAVQAMGRILVAQLATIVAPEPAVSARADEHAPPAATTSAG